MVFAALRAIPWLTCSGKPSSIFSMENYANESVNNTDNYLCSKCHLLLSSCNLRQTTSSTAKNTVFKIAFVLYCIIHLMLIFSIVIYTN